MTCRDKVLTKPELSIIKYDLSPFDHKETDSRMILHVHPVLKNAFSDVWHCMTVYTMYDTDVLVLAISAAARCNNKHLRVSFGVGDLHHAIWDCKTV